MGLLPLEFTDCLTDSPYFRENLHAHEKELERTSQQIKGLIKDVKDLLNAAKSLSRAQRNLSQNLQNFHFECIGSSQTDDEIVIAGSLKEFGKLIANIEDERDRMLDQASDQFIRPLDNFRKEHIGGVKEGKKKFEKQTAKFCQSQERYLNLSTKKQDNILQEADASLEMEQRHFCQASLEYIFLLQEVQERKKFEFVETILGFMYGWLTFYHQGYEVAKDCKPYMKELQIKIQTTRANFSGTRDQAENLMKKMLEVRKTKPLDAGSLNKMYTRQGYLLLMEKKAFGTTWSKHYCQYQKENKIFTMIPYNQTTGKITSTDTMTLRSCVRRMSDTIEKRFCFDITADDRLGVIYTLQALSEEDRRLWMDAMDGKEPTYTHPGKLSKPEETTLNDVGFNFVNRCINELERRGLEEQGLYRVVGVTSKVGRLLLLGLDRRKAEKLSLEDPFEWETKTITSALKTYLRHLPEPIMTYRYHTAFLAAAKQETRSLRINDVHTLSHRIPELHRKMLFIVLKHLKRVAEKAEKNKMGVSNLGVCFGPTLLRPEEETMASIMEIKFCNVVVEILIENSDRIMTTPPPSDLPTIANHNYNTPAKPPLSAAYTHPVPPSVTNNYSNNKPDVTYGTSNHRGTNSHVAPPLISPSSMHHLTPVTTVHAVITSYNDGPIPVLINNKSPRDPQANRYNSIPSLTSSSVYNNGIHHSNRGSPPVRGSMENMLSVSNNSSTTPTSVNNTSHHNQGNNLVTSASESRLWPPPTQPNNHVGYINKVKPVHFINKMASPDSSNESRESSLPPIPSTTSNNILNTSTDSVSWSPGGGEYYPPHISQPSSRNNVMDTRGTRNDTPPIKIHHIDSGTSNQTTNHSPSTPSPPSQIPRRVRTLYACVGEHEGELSFEPNQIITNIRLSLEPGWLEGTLNGRSGLVPQNYVEYLP